MHNLCLKHNVFKVFVSALLLFTLAGGLTPSPLAMANPNASSRGATIVLTVVNPPAGAWTAVQWGNADSTLWHNVDNWVVPLTLDQKGQMRWRVDPKDFGTGPFRWVIYDKDPAQGGIIVRVSQAFNFPTRENESVSVSITIVSAVALTWVTVPAGNFLMGSTTGDDDEKPPHSVYLNAYQIGKYEVTNEQYAQCVKTGVCQPALDRQGQPYRYIDPQYARHPVVYVSWYSAVAFCTWAGGRLPTEAEWEKAARGTDGRTYPWGNQAPNATLVNYDENVEDTTQVGTYPAGASPYGALDMAGNAWEWTADWYDDEYYPDSPSANPVGPETGYHRVLRGGSSWDSARQIRTSYRAGPSVHEMPPNSIGLRCARSVSSANTAWASDAPTSASTPPPTPAPLTAVRPISTEISAADRMVMVYVPAGEFLMGSKDTDPGASNYENEKPQHTVYLDAFWIDQTEVTNAMYAQCVKADVCLRPYPTESNTHPFYYGNPQYDRYPVIYVSWDDAQTYCSWAGKRLPTSAEWEKAARGTDGRLYTWGDQNPSPKRGNYSSNDTMPVGSFPRGASPYGALDMGGNVAEWVVDWYADDYYQYSPRDNPTGPATGDYKFVRGGAWNHSSTAMRTAYAWGVPPDVWQDWIGFRCVR